MPEIKFPTEWVKINDNVYDGDHLRFMDAGTLEDDRWTFDVAIIHDGAVVETKKMNINKTNGKVVIGLYGSNSDNWVGKLVKVAKIKTRNPQTGLQVDSIALEAPDPTFAAADSAGMVATK